MIIAVQNKQLITKIYLVAEDTQKPVGEGEIGRKRATGWEMFYRNLKYLIKSPWLPLCKHRPQSDGEG